MNTRHARPATATIREPEARFRIVVEIEARDAPAALGVAPESEATGRPRGTRPT